MNNPETQATRYRTKINKTSKATKNTIQKPLVMKSIPTARLIVFLVLCQWVNIRFHINEFF
jgi:hypothetical protein